MALCALVCALCALALKPACAEDAMKAIDDRLKKADRPDAPALDGAAAWINVEKPLTMADLKGKIVLFDFWTFG